ncbi:MFS transporter [Pseudonocardia pini]|uniref:MFS transporter n=1 Tax=Pseudonocardia pini TaxID=2758030 RepID=UPI0015F0EDC3|nr:MFS transporter [Pseudonocardia pini]
MALPAGVRRGYALGSVATGTFGTVPGLLLLPYLTDSLGVAAGLAGLLVVLPKAWDVVLNPVAGRISDRAGVRRPFLLWAGIALAVCFALMFAGPADPVWVVVLFLACATAYAFFQVPYVAMPAEMTADPTERTSVMTWRVAVLAVAILVSGATAPLVADAAGHAAMGVYVGVLLLVGSLGAWFGTRSAPRVGATVASGTLGEQLRTVAAVPDFRRLLVTWVVQALGIGTLLAGAAYTARYLLGDPATSSLLFAAFVGPALLVTPLCARYAARRGKRSGYVVSSLLLAAGALGTLAAYSGSVVATCAAAAVAGVGYAGAQVFPLAMLPDVAAEDARGSGASRAGMFAGVWTAGETLGLALGPGIYALVLQLGGYRGGGTADQPDSALLAVAIGFAVVPAVLVLAGLLGLRGYTLDERDPA